MSHHNHCGEPLFLSIDNGTQSIRALIFDAKGQLLAKSKIELTAYYSKQPGWAEQDPEYFWQSLKDCCQKLWLQPEVIDKQYQKSIKAVSLTTQRGTVINLDNDGNPLRPAILWLDQRLANDELKLPWYWRLIFKCIGQSKTIRYFYRKAQCNWLAQNQPEVWQKTNKFLLLSGFLTYKLIGEYKDSSASIVGYLPFNFKSFNWANKFSWKWKVLNINAEMLPELVKPGKELGKISEHVATELGLEKNTPLIASASDKACEVLGSGCFSSNSASLSYGTTATINVNTQRYIGPKAFIPPYPSAVAAQYNTEVMIYRGFWMINWFKQEFGLREVQLAKEQGVTPESLYDKLLAEIPPGSMGLTLQPYWSPGLQNLEAKGAIIGFGDVHTRAHIYRAIIEGLAYALREGKENIERRQGSKIEAIFVSGGGSQSDEVLQLTADVFNLPVYRPHTFETSGLGAAINAAVGTNIYPDYKTAVEQMTHIKSTFYPTAKNVALYQALYKKVYLKLYQNLKPIYQQISDITGYPEI